MSAEAAAIADLTEIARTALLELRHVAMRADLRTVELEAAAASLDAFATHALDRLRGEDGA